MAWLAADVLGIIGRENMRDSAFFQQVLAEGEELGESKARRADIVRVLRSRFKLANTDDLTSALSSTVDPERLDALFDLALDCTSLDEFQATLASA
jgi:hypothetical protein